MSLQKAERIAEHIWREGFKPDPILTVSEWADRHRRLPKRSSAEPGPWRTSRTPYLREIMDCLSVHSPVEQIKVMKGTQLGFTECGNNWFGYTVHIAPGPMLMVFPTVDLARRHSKTKLTPTIKDTAILRERIREARSRDSGNTILEKDFLGGSVLLTGANAATGLRHISIRNLFMDEIDGYPQDVEGEGDPVGLATNRTDAFSNRKIFKISTPTIKDRSRIEQEYEESDKRHYYVPCPHCKHMQWLKWEQIKFEHEEYRLKNTPHYECEACKKPIEEYHKTWMLENGKWIAENPGHEHRGYHLSSLYSPLGWLSWTEIVKEFLLANKRFNETGDKTLLKRWRNTRLALTWEEYQQIRSENEILRLCDERPRGIVPSEDVVGLTGGVDVQDNGFWYVIRAWGEHLGSWLIREGFVETWEQLETVLWGSRYKDVEEKEYVLRLVFIDAMGHRTAEVYDFCRGKQGIRPIKGEQRMASPYSVTKIDVYPGTKKPIPGGVRLYRLHSNYYKDELSNRLQINPADPGAFRLHAETTDEYPQQMIAEYVSEKGVWECRSGRANHYWDVEYMALAAADILGFRYAKPKNGEPKGRRKRKIIDRGVSA